jgi:hypothetical protein
MRKEYGLVGGRSNPYARRKGKAGHSIVLDRLLRSEHYVRLDDDVAETSPVETVVNETLRLVLKAKTLARTGRAGPVRATGGGPCSDVRRRRLGTT